VRSLPVIVRIADDPTGADAAHPQIERDTAKCG
jgi:hypothetical protein